LLRKAKEVLEELKKKGYVQQKEGAWWFVSKEHRELLGDRECVLVRRTGKFTYFLLDIAYHLDKIERGFDCLIDIWGADHFGHVPRLQAGLEALGHKDKLMILLYQPVQVKKGEEIVPMAKRKGTYLTADEILDLVDPDVFKGYLLQKTMNSPLIFDLKVYEEESKKSPVFYLKYMSARIHGILRKTKKDEVEPRYDLFKEAEWELIKRISFVAYKLRKTAELLEPHFIYEEAQKFARAFHLFYEKAPIKQEKDPQLRRARLDLLEASLITAQTLTEVLNIELPERL
ncbi:arginine--tRNA ligase, partial [bacterium]|nr:arginine--tRNA ligase [bacterium]